MKKIEWWAVKVGFRNFLNFIKRPYGTIRPNLEDKDWHHHICIPLRFGNETFETFCPHKDNKNLYPEFSDCCDFCPYMGIVDAPDGKMRIVTE